MWLHRCLRTRHSPAFSLIEPSVDFSPPQKTRLILHTFPTSVRRSSSVSPIFAEYHRKRREQLDEDVDEEDPKGAPETAETPPRPPASTTDRLMRRMPEFVPTTYWGHRDSVREILERVDLVKRRSVIDLPEFYVGSTVAVTVADPQSPSKTTRFVGICIAKGDPGLQHNFVLRNVIDGQGIEISYELYNPLIREITVINLERRLDDEMFYLRDALPEYSTVPLDAKPVPRSASDDVPLNETLVKMKPRPWTQRWERKGLRGVDEETIVSQLSRKMRLQRIEPTRNQVWQKYDLVLQYRNSVTREETEPIYGELASMTASESESGSSTILDDRKVVVKRRKRRNVGNQSGD